MKRDHKRDLEIVEKATRGPWIDYARYGDSSIYGHEIRLGDEDGPILAEDVSANNAQFIVEAREGWPEAIRRAMAAEAEVERLRTEIQRHIDLLESSAKVIAGIESGNRDFNMGISAAYRTAAKHLREILAKGETYRCIECGKSTANWVEVCGECIDKALREEKPGDF